VSFANSNSDFPSEKISCSDIYLNFWLFGGFSEPTSRNTTGVIMMGLIPCNVSKQLFLYSCIIIILFMGQELMNDKVQEKIMKIETQFE
jgi:uncharacterized membrane protein